MEKENNKKFEISFLLLHNKEIRTEKVKEWRKN